MGIPISVLLGLVLLIAHGEMASPLPGPPPWWGPWTLLLMVVPWLIARSTGRRLERMVKTRFIATRRLFAALRLQQLAVPACFGVMVFVGDLPGQVTHWLPETATLQVAGLIGPLALMEISLRLTERRNRVWLERVGIAGGGISKISVMFLVVVPLMVLAVAADVVELNRGLSVFVHQTALGNALALIGVVAVLCFALPLMVLLVFPVTRALPERVASEIHATAESLGFSRRRVLAMNTHHAVINAALVGPVRWPRYLILTDGLLSYLEPTPLKGVVAHEVGHAKANHPGWLVLLFAGIPILLVHPLLAMTWPDWPWWAWTVVAGAVFGLGVLTLRIVAHRFEYEADQLSAEALGGAVYCVTALRRVGELSPRTRRRASLRHPSENQRILHMYACERDPEVARRFWRRGTWMRRAIVATLVVALGLSVWGHALLWPLDSAVHSFFTGDLAEAEAQLVELEPDLTESQREVAERLAEQARLGISMGFESVEWSDIQRELAPAAREVAIAEMVRGSDDDDVLPWLSLALYEPDREAWLETVYLYHATPSEEADQRRVLLGHLETLERPEVVTEWMARTAAGQ